MADLPRGRGHDKHSDRTRIESSKGARKSSAAPSAAAPAASPSPATVNVPVHELAALGARWDVQQRERDYKLQQDILRQMKEMNWYLRQGALIALGADRSDEMKQKFDQAVQEAIGA